HPDAILAWNDTRAVAVDLRPHRQVLPATTWENQGRFDEGARLTRAGRGRGGGHSMAFNVRKRGKLTYYYQGDRPVLSALVTEELPDGDLKIHFAGLTGGYSAKGVLNLDELVTMDPQREVPLVFQCWELWLREAG